MIQKFFLHFVDDGKGDYWFDLILSDHKLKIIFIIKIFGDRSLIRLNFNLTKYYPMQITVSFWRLLSLFMLKILEGSYRVIEFLTNILFQQHPFVSIHWFLDAWSDRNPKTSQY